MSSPVGPICSECGSPMIPDTEGDVWCHRCNVEFELWLDEATDDRPCND